MKRKKGSIYKERGKKENKTREKKNQRKREKQKSCHLNPEFNKLYSNVRKLILTSCRKKRKMMRHREIKREREKNWRKNTHLTKGIINKKSDDRNDRFIGWKIFDWKTKEKQLDKAWRKSSNFFRLKKFVGFFEGDGGVSISNMKKSEILY